MPKLGPTSPNSPLSQHTATWRHFLPIATIVCVFWFVWRQFGREQLALDPYSHLANYCAHVPAITQDEFLGRQDLLAAALRDLGAAAYVAEPGANTLFYANFSQAHWRLSERPLLLAVSPRPADSGARLSIVTPKFEETRARQLPIPTGQSSAIEYAEWPEEGDPYAVLLSALHTVSDNDTIYVDSGIRKFIVDGLQRVAPSLKILSAPLALTQMRERKSSAEIDIMQCANEATLLAIRAVHKRLMIGKTRESHARGMMATALATAGLQAGGCLTLFGENAALPHGSGSDRTLGKQDFALFDCTASLHGYYSDVTRTVALEDSEIPEDHLKIWAHVRSAQDVALSAVKEGVETKSVDQAGRKLLGTYGYGAYFTHRLGHGIGLEVHEQPYLRGGSDDLIKTGHTFSDEPGVYIEGQVGVRLEDCFYVTDGGTGRFLTEKVGGPSRSPWKP